MLDINIKDLNAWLEKYDSNAEIDVLLNLINKKIKIECLVDSIMCYAKQDYENADSFTRRCGLKTKNHIAKNVSL